MKYIERVASGAPLNPEEGAQRRKSGKCRKMKKQMMKSRWSLYSHLKMKNNSLANRNRGTISRFLFCFVFLPFCKVSRPAAFLQINVLLDAEFITTKLKSIKIEDFYLGRK